MTAIKNLTYLKLLHQYSKNSPRQFKILIENSSTKELKAVCELILNILHGKLQVSGVSRLKIYKNNLRNLSNKKLPLVKRRQFLKHGRGFILPLLSMGLPALINLFKK